MTNFIVVCGSCGCNNSGRTSYCRRCGAPLCAYIPNYKNYSSQRCARCGKPITQCECWTGPIMNHFDVSFDCYTCECHFDNQQEPQPARPRLLLTSNSEDICYFMEQSLIPVIQFKDCLKNKEKDVVNDNNMLEFILSRLETIENCWAALWLNKKIQSMEYLEFQDQQDIILEHLNSKHTINSLKDNLFWIDLKKFEDYIEFLLKSSPLKK